MSSETQDNRSQLSRDERRMVCCAVWKSTKLEMTLWRLEKAFGLTFGAIRDSRQDPNRLVRRWAKRMRALSSRACSQVSQKLQNYNRRGSALSCRILEPVVGPGSCLTVHMKRGGTTNVVIQGMSPIHRNASGFRTRIGWSCEYA